MSGVKFDLSDCFAYNLVRLIYGPKYTVVISGVATLGGSKTKLIPIDRQVRILNLMALKSLQLFPTSLQQK